MNRLDRCSPTHLYSNGLRGELSVIAREISYPGEMQYQLWVTDRPVGTTSAPGRTRYWTKRECFNTVTQSLSDGLRTIHGLCHPRFAR